MADGFLGRWSQRKQAATEGKPLAEPVPAPVFAPQQPASALATSHPAATEDPAPAGPETAPPAESPKLSLDDVKALTPDSSYAPFVNQGVAPEVRNAAMKKLFADPHYNVMDGLDIYIDDYSKPDPLPASMLRKMASAHFLKLFDDEDEAAKTAQPASDAPVQTREADDVAIPSEETKPESTPATRLESDPSYEQTPHALDETQDHDHTDLRLQPNHAAGPQEPGRGTE